MNKNIFSASEAINVLSKLYGCPYVTTDIDGYIGHKGKVVETLCLDGMDGEVLPDVCYDSWAGDRHIEVFEDGFLQGFFVGSEDEPRSKYYHILTKLQGITLDKCDKIEIDLNKFVMNVNYNGHHFNFSLIVSPAKVKEYLNNL